MAAGLTQEDLAERAGLSVRGLRYLEQDSRRPYPDTVRRVADALGASAEDRRALLAGRRPEPASPATGGHPRAGIPPAPSGPLIGRDAELAGVVALLGHDDVRAVTVTGPGGVGKTRLAVEVARRLQGEPVWVALDSLRDARLVPGAIGRAFGIVQTGAVPEADAIALAVGAGQATILIVDNLEHLLDAVGFLATLLSRCPGLKVLATSRAALRLRGEHEFPLSPFRVPSGQLIPMHAMATNPAIDLFLRRAQAVRPQFTLSGSNVVAVAAICRELDGLPLAVELAAARIRVLSPQDVLTRLRHRRLAFLSGGPIGGAARHSTMRATVDWSHDLLDPDAKAVFRRLSVFHGGCTLADAEAVVQSHVPVPADIVDVVEDLQRSSLLIVTDVDGRDVRLRMLETIRTYGREQLDASGEHAILHRCHALHFLSVAEMAANHFYSPDAGAWISRLADDNDNLRAALRWALDGGDADTALAFTAALWSFWYLTGQITEGRAATSAILHRYDSIPACRPLARTLLGAGQLALASGDYRHGQTLLDRSIAMNRGVDDARGTAEALLAAGFAARLSNQPAEARRLLGDALTLAHETAHPFVTAAAAHHLGMLAAAHGDHDAAGRLLNDSLTRYQQLRLRRFVALVELGLGELALAIGDTSLAEKRIHASLTDMLAAHAALDVPAALESCADLAAATGNLQHAVRLAAAAAARRATTGSRPWPDAQRRRDQWLNTARIRLTEAAYTAAWTEGEHMTIHQGVAVQR
jgi:predicted ATPase